MILPVLCILLARQCLRLPVFGLDNIVCLQPMASALPASQQEHGSVLYKVGMCSSTACSKLGVPANKSIVSSAV
jgi:hypothetical protein